ARRRAPAGRGRRSRAGTGGRQPGGPPGPLAGGADGADRGRPRRPVRHHRAGPAVRRGAGGPRHRRPGPLRRRPRPRGGRGGRGAGVVEWRAGEQGVVGLLSGALVEPAGPPGALVSVLSGRGGAGASVLASALAAAAARAGRWPLLVDGDPLGGGVDLLLGGEAVGGLRWPDLAGCTGAVSPSTLRDALPWVHGVRVLAAGRVGPVELPVPAVRAVLDAGRRFADPVVVDVSRSVGAVPETVLAEASRGLLAVADEVRGGA